MPLYVISYDLRKQRNYDALLKQLREWGCVRPLLSVWLGELNGPVDAIRDILRGHMDADDGVLVMELKTGSQWASFKLLPGAVEWLKSKIP